MCLRSLQEFVALL